MLAGAAAPRTPPGAARRAWPRAGAARSSAVARLPAAGVGLAVAAAKPWRQVAPRRAATGNVGLNKPRSWSSVASARRRCANGIDEVSLDAAWPVQMRSQPRLVLEEQRFQPLRPRWRSWRRGLASRQSSVLDANYIMCLPTSSACSLRSAIYTVSANRARGCGPILRHQDAAPHDPSACRSTRPRAVRGLSAEAA